MASEVGEEEDMGFPVAERFCLCFLVSVWLFPSAVSNGSRAMIENPSHRDTVMSCSHRSLHCTPLSSFSTSILRLSRPSRPRLKELSCLTKSLFRQSSQWHQQDPRAAGGIEATSVNECQTANRWMEGGQR